MVKEKKWVTLNVGGILFMTSRPTLTRAPSQSPLNRIAVNSTQIQFDRDERGAYLIDRDPAYFQVVLNFLRHGHLLMTKDITEEGILLEAEYYVIPELTRLIKARMTSRSMSNFLSVNQPQDASHNYSLNSSSSLFGNNCTSPFLFGGVEI